MDFKTIDKKLLNKLKNHAKYVYFIQSAKIVNKSQEIYSYLNLDNPSIVNFFIKTNEKKQFISKDDFLKLFNTCNDKINKDRYIFNKFVFIDRYYEENFKTGKILLYAKKEFLEKLLK